MPNFYIQPPYPSKRKVFIAGKDGHGLPFIWTSLRVSDVGRVAQIKMDWSQLQDLQDEVGRLLIEEELKDVKGFDDLFNKG